MFGKFWYDYHGENLSVTSVEMIDCARIDRGKLDAVLQSINKAAQAFLTQYQKKNKKGEKYFDIGRENYPHYVERISSIINTTRQNQSSSEVKFLVIDALYRFEKLASLGEAVRSSIMTNLNQYGQYGSENLLKWLNDYKSFWFRQDYKEIYDEALSNYEVCRTHLVEYLHHDPDSFEHDYAGSERKEQIVAMVDTYKDSKQLNDKACKISQDIETQKERRREAERRAMAQYTPL